MAAHASRPLAAPEQAGALVTIPVSAGELIDKMTILALKTRRVRDVQKRLMAARELALLERAAGFLRAADEADKIATLAQSLETVNGALWDVEDALRCMERDLNFGPAFIEAARRVYHLNDERARLKNAVNAAAGCSLMEVKEHPDY